MKTFKHEDFSPIHYYPEVPSKKGWYISTWFTLDGLHSNGFPEITDWRIDFLWYWDGKHWKTSPRGCVSFTQERNWFGLKEKP